MPSTACGGDLTRRPLAALSLSPLCNNSVDVGKRAFAGSHRWAGANFTTELLGCKYLDASICLTWRLYHLR